MNKQHAILFGLALMTTKADHVYAQNEENYEASIALGYVGTSGNTDTDTFNTEILFALHADKWEHNLKFQGLGSQENAQATAERYFLQNKSDYKFDGDQYLFIKGSYTDDRFSGFDYQVAISSGYGRHFLNNDRFELQAFGGVGYRQNDIINADRESETIASVGEEFKWSISDNAVFTQSFSSEIGDQRAISVLEIGLETNIIGDITTKVTFQARNNSKVPEGRKKTDTLTSLSLVYSF